MTLEQQGGGARRSAAIPELLPPDPDDRDQAFRAIGRIVTAPGKLSAEGKRRLKRIQQLFGVKDIGTSEADAGARK